MKINPWTKTLLFMLAVVLAWATAAGASAPPSPPEDRSPSRPTHDLSSLAAGFPAKQALEEIPLLPGWNQISLPETPEIADPEEILADIEGSYHRAYTYDGCDTADPWKFYDPNNSANSDLSAIAVEQGLLIDATAAVSLPSDGALPDATTFNLCTGWNLIGFPGTQPRHVRNALAPILDKVVRVFAFDPFDFDDNWKFFEAGVPAWASDLETMEPGKGYWILVTEDVEFDLKNVGDAPTVTFISPQDLDVLTAPTEIQGTVASDLLDNWQLRYRGVGDSDWIDLATGNYPTEGKLGTFDPTLLLNGMYELELVATDLQGQQVTDSIAIIVEGNMKIGHFTLSFLDLTIPLSGLDIDIIRTYDSRQRHLSGDFGYGWYLDIRQGSYRNNRPPGDGWQILATGGPFGLPCQQVTETKNHLTTVRLSDREVYRFRLTVKDPGTIVGGCIGRAEFEYVDGPVPGATLEILGGSQVLYQNGTDELRDPDSFDLYVPQDVRLTTRDGRIFDLDLLTGVSRLEDLNGNSLEITANGIIHSSGQSIIFERDAEGRILRIADPMGHANLYTYSETGDHIQYFDREGNKATYFYRDQQPHLFEKLEDPRGVTPVRNDYDEDGRLVRHIDAYGKAIEIQHDLATRREITTNRLGYSKVQEYDLRGNVVRETDESGSTTERFFDSRDNLLKIVDPLGRTTEYTYNHQNDVVAIKDALGQVNSFTYNDLGRTTSSLLPDGSLTTYAYDRFGNLLKIIDPANQTSEFEYDLRGNVLNQINTNGSMTSFTYDEYGRRRTETNALGAITESDYDRNGNIIEEKRSRTLEDGSVETLATRLEYDPLDRHTKTVSADGTVVQTAYDEIGNVIRRTDPQGRATTITYDSMGRQTSTRFPDGTSRSISYDAAGQIISQVDRNGATTQFSYDAAGRLLTKTFPDGARVTRTLDAVGQVLQVRDALGHSTSFTYDTLGRRTETIDALGNTTSFEYDARGLIVKGKDPRGFETRFLYDSLGRLSTIVYPDASTRRVGYSPLGQRVSETDQSGLTTRYEYDALGRLTTVQLPSGQVTRSTYDEIGNRLTQTDANGRTTPSCRLTRGHDSKLRLLTLPYRASRKDRRGRTDRTGLRIRQFLSNDSISRQ